MIIRQFKNVIGVILASTLVISPTFLSADEGGAVAASASVSGVSYADLADLADPAEIVAKVRIRKQATLEPERSPGVANGHVRLYVVAKVEESLKGHLITDQPIRYLVDVPLDRRGKPPVMKNMGVTIFARAAPAKPGDLQLVAPTASLALSPADESRLRTILAELSEPNAAARVMGLRDVLAVPGNLAGESETQIFLTTEGGGTALISVMRRPGAAPVWGVSWDELVDGAGGPPMRDTLAWYRLACFLPPAIPRGANLGARAEVRALAEEDYRLVRRGLGNCPRMPKSVH